MVSAVPTTSIGAARAESAENWGESATTVTPHAKSNVNPIIGDRVAVSGKIRQISPEIERLPNATAALPIRRLSHPPAMQPAAPTAITEKDSMAVIVWSGDDENLSSSMSKGAIVQNA